MLYALNKEHNQVVYTLTNSFSGICSGKNSVADYLTQQHGFIRLHLTQSISSEDRPCLGHPETTTEQISFDNVHSLLELVTKQWQQRWVMTDVWDENVLENLLRRPSFILVSVDAPVGLRWKRLKEQWAQKNPSLMRRTVLNVIADVDDEIRNHQLWRISCCGTTNIFSIRNSGLLA